MSLLDDIRDAVSIADAETLDLQPQVTHVMWAGENYAGEVTTVSVKRRALVEEKQQLVKSMTGDEMVTSKTYIGILRPIKPLNVPGRIGVVDPRDEFILPDGTRGPVVATDGFIDAGTGRKMYAQIYLG